VHTAIRMHHNQYDAGDPRLFSRDADVFNIQHHLSRMGRPADEESIHGALSRLQQKGSVQPGVEWDTWSAS
jgi:hypothetical protein